MPRKPATARRIPRSRCHAFDFNPWEWLDAADWKDLKAVLEPQGAAGGFPGLRLWRLRTDCRTVDVHRTPWSIEVPLGAFSSFSKDLCTPESDLEGRERLYDRMRDHRRVQEGPRRHGPVGLGFSAVRDVLVREGAIYYKEAAITEFRYHADNRQLFWALHKVLRTLRDNPNKVLASSNTYMKDGILRRRVLVKPLKERLKTGIRGPAWTDGEDVLIRDVFKRGFVFTEPQFDAQEARFLEDGKMPRDRTAVVARGREEITAVLKHQRSYSAIRQRIYHLNRLTRQKYARNGRVPATSQKAFAAAYLGIEERGLVIRETTKDSWLLIGQTASGPVFIDHAKALLLRASTIGKALAVPFHVVAFVRMRMTYVDKVIESLAEHHQLHDWFTPSMEVMDVVYEYQQQTLEALAAGKKRYLSEAKRLRAWLSWDLLKHAQDETLSLWSAPRRRLGANQEPSQIPTVPVS